MGITVDEQNHASRSHEPIAIVGMAMRLLAE